MKNLFHPSRVYPSRLHTCMEAYFGFLLTLFFFLWGIDVGARIKSSC